MRRRAWLGYSGAALLALCARGAHAHGVTLKFAHLQPADSALHKEFAAVWVQRLEEASAGRLRLHLEPGVGGDAAELLAQVKQGAIDIACVPIAPGSAPETEKLASGADAENASRALWEHVRANDLARKEFGGVRLLAVATSNRVLVALAMNPAAYKALTDDLRQALNAVSGGDTSAWLGEVLGGAK
jgi:hypothetical protein